MISNAFRAPPNPASASATIGANQSRETLPSACSISSARFSAIVDAGEFGAGIGRIKRLIGIHCAGDIGVGGNLPAGEIDRLEAAANHLHRLVAGDRAERVDIGSIIQQFPELVGAALGERIRDRKRAAQPHDILGAIGPADALEAPIRGRRNQIFKRERLAHQHTPK